MTEKTKTGEDYTHVHHTSFNVPWFKNGTLTWVKASVRCPKSEFVFYKGIQRMRDTGKINEFVRLSAEFQLFGKGFKVVA